ncbi:MAG: phosphoribosyltransferase family protein [Oscillospiraceae bacterium]
MRAGEFIEQLLFPPRCEFCDEILPIGGSCGKCSRILKSSEISLSDMFGDNNLRNLDSVDCAIACYTYKDEIRELLSRYKFLYRRELRSLISRRMTELVREIYGESEIDAVVAVPSYRNKNPHAELLAKDIAYNLGVGFYRSALVKKRKTAKQHSLRGDERAENLSRAFTAREAVRYKTVLLCDDVITSGSTFNECAKALKSAGAEFVLCVAFAAAMLDRE